MSQFKKTKGLNNRSPSPIVSQKNSRANQISNESGNYLRELQNANIKNQNLMDSLLDEGLLGQKESKKTENSNLILSNKDILQADIDISSNDIIKGDSQYSRPDNKNYSFVKPETEAFHSKDDTFRKKSAENFVTEENPNNKEYDNPQITNFDPQRSQDPNISEPLVDKIEDFHDEEVPPQETFYKKNLEQVLLVITLKKIVQRLQNDNTKLKQKSSEQDRKEHEFVNKIRKLENTLEELKLRDKLWNNHPSDYIKYDLEDLNIKLKSIDRNLDNATADGVQERFLEDVVNKNQEYLIKSNSNTEALKGLKNNMGRLKNTLLSMNNI
jgi:hypothetical protein